MLFSSASFLYLFLPAVLLVYFAAPKRWKNGVLLLSSVLFYFFGEPAYTLLLLASSLSGYLFSLRIERHRGTPRAKRAMILSTAANLLILGFFKYADWVVETINAVTGVGLPLPGIQLPIGISFFTFQTMSYVFDVYMGTVKPAPNFASLATFISLFPQLIAGPIVRYTDVAVELVDRKTTLSAVSYGVRRFVIGLAKKVLIANAMGELVSAFSKSGEKSVVFYWLFIGVYMLQIYFDFSGYSDMAIGLGRMFAFNFPENFNYPYISRSIAEFWRRWHMTLGGWFRDYVYIPMGGNRVKPLLWVRNIFVVWALTGLWHGASWNFVLWGLFFGVMLMLEKLVLAKPLQKAPGWVSHAYVLFFVAVSFGLFAADEHGGVRAVLSGMFGTAGLPAFSFETGYYLKSYAVLLAFGIIAATPLGTKLWARLNRGKGERFVRWLEPAALCGLMIACTAALVDGSFNPFLYFRF